MKFKHSIFILLTPFFLTPLISCSEFNKSKRTAEEKEDREYEKRMSKLRSDYAPVEGTYTGNIEAQDRNIPVELRIAVIETDNGMSSFGKARSLPKLRATLTQLDSAHGVVNLTVAYEQKTGRMILNTPDVADQIEETLWSIVSTLSNNQIVGQVRQNNAVLGTLRLKMKGRDLIAPSLDQENERIRNLLREIEGRFVGKIQFGSNPLTNMDVEILVSVTATGKPEPHITCILIINGERFGIELMRGNYIPNPRPGTLYVEATGKPFVICPLNSFVARFLDNKLIIDGNLLRGGRAEAIFTRLNF
jgi:hypothetical protein